jgi:hypothetical protein
MTPGKAGNARRKLMPDRIADKGKADIQPTRNGYCRERKSALLPFLLLNFLPETVKSYVKSDVSFPGYRHCSGNGRDRRFYAHFACISFGPDVQSGYFENPHPFLYGRADTNKCILRLIQRWKAWNN